MKIRITDLLDHYYDDSVRLDMPQKYEAHTNTTPTSKTTPKKFSMQKPMLIAASLLLVLCGGVVLRLALSANPSGSSLSEVPGSTMEISSEISSGEPEEMTVEPEPSQGKTVYGAQINLQIAPNDALLTESGDYITTLEIDPSQGTYTWSYHLPALEALFWEVSPDGRLSEALSDEAFNQALTDWQNYLLEQYFNTAVISFGDGTTCITGGGDAVGFEDSVFCEEGKCVDLIGKIPESLTIGDTSYEFESRTVEMESQTEEITSAPTEETNVITAYGLRDFSLTLYVTEEYEENCEIIPTGTFTSEQHISYALGYACDETEAYKSITHTCIIRDWDGNDVASFSSEHNIPGSWTEVQNCNDLPESIETPGYYSMEIYLDGELVMVTNFSVVEPGISYAAAEDLNGDGILTALLNEPITCEGMEGTILRFEIDLSRNLCIWYFDNDALEDLHQAYEEGTCDWDEYNEQYLLWTTYLTETYYQASTMVFSDGSELPLTFGDRVVYEDGLIVEDFMLPDFLLSNGNSPSCLVFNGQTYEFE